MADKATSTASPPPVASSSADAAAGATASSPPSAPTPEEEAGLIGVDPEFEAEEGHGDVDSALGDDESLNLSSTASVSSTILQYRKLHGRTYQNWEGAEYWGPNDNTQNEGLDIAHHMMYLAFDNKLHLAPLGNVQKVLDVGTGTGIWAIDFADEHPSAEVIGTDLSPIQSAWVPPNCKFELDNCELDWTYPDNTFDYIHVRGLLGSIVDWPRFYQQCLRTLKPGGWLEHQEFSLPISADDGSIPEGSVWDDWGNVFKEAVKKNGRSFEVTLSWVDWAREAGFTGEIHQDMVKLPIGGWAADPRWKEVGLFNRMSLDHGLEGFASYVCTMLLGWQRDEVEVLLARVRNIIKDRTVHAYYPLKTIYTQKPI